MKTRTILFFGSLISFVCTSFAEEAVKPLIEKAADSVKAAVAPVQKPKWHPEGYTDTPKLPHCEWLVHDLHRPAPRVVLAGQKSSEPPSDAIILFDGKDLSAWQHKDGTDAQWEVKDGFFEVTRTGNIYTREAFGDCQLHIEWRVPDPPQRNSQRQGNSGIFFMGKYEVQILDCYNNKTYADGYAGSIYGQYPPLVNASRKPGVWQEYDIIFIAPRFDNEKLVKPAYVTVIHNGVVVQHHTELLGATTHKKLPKYEWHLPRLPLSLQDHKDRQALCFRNIWIRPLNQE